MPEIVQDAIDFVIDPVRTARTRIVDLDNVEKTFVGLKVEHFFRDFIDVPKGIRDLSIDGIDVDIKNTVGTTWTIPPETYRNSEPVLLFLIADALGHCSVGLMVAKPEYLRPGENRDTKRSVSASARAHIRWLIEKERLPDSRWVGIDMARFRELRKLRGGSLRAASFFRENLDHPVHRSVVQSLLFDQRDYMKRLRGNHGARDQLFDDGIALLSGAYHNSLIAAFGLPQCESDEHIAHKMTQADRAIVAESRFFKRRG
ncbi:MAG: NaeI family type II restriction endonuclease [Devosia sp.]|nr:NaeI family type II restriction endonuclease [Devosia sp.]